MKVILLKQPKRQDIIMGKNISTYIIFGVSFVLILASFFVPFYTANISYEFREVFLWEPFIRVIVGWFLHVLFMFGGCAILPDLFIVIFGIYIFMWLKIFKKQNFSHLHIVIFTFSFLELCTFNSNSQELVGTICTIERGYYLFLIGYVITFLYTLYLYEKAKNIIKIF